MTLYDLMIKTNHHLIKDGELNDNQKRNICNQLLDGISSREQAARFYIGVKFPNNIDRSGRRMYPIYYIPPYNDGKKLKTILGQTPKTHILSANMYELEIIRLLHMLNPSDSNVKMMVSKTLERLRTTCFGGESKCGVGECYDSSLIVLRFLAATVPHEHEWIDERISTYYRHYDEKKRPWYIKWYFWLCLSELPFEIAEPNILRYKNEILTQLTRSCVMNSEGDRTIHPVIMCAIRNVIARLPEYEYIKNREPYVDEKDGRLYFNMQPSLM